MIKLRFFNEKEKIWIGPLGILIFFTLYIISNRFNIFEPIYLHIFEFEKIIPFIHWTIWIYLSAYILVALVFIILKNKENMNKIFYSQILLLIFSTIIFILIPTIYSRPAIEYSGFNSHIMQILYTLDNPTNAFPSLHVGMAFLAIYGFLNEKKRLFSIFLIWGILISITTLTVKQHYFIDIVGGLLMSIICYYIGGKFIKEKVS